MNIYRNINFTKRNYECQQIVACESADAPSKDYEPCNPAILNRLTHLYTQDGVRYWGFA